MRFGCKNNESQTGSRYNGNDVDLRGEKAEIGSKIENYENANKKNNNNEINNNKMPLL